MDLTLNTDLGKVNVRVAAWIENKGRILVSQFPDGVVSLPGVRVKFSETTTEAIQREIVEETGEHLEEIELFSVIENFFLEEQSHTNYHEFLFIYKGQIEERENYNGIDNSNQVIVWEPIEIIDQLKPHLFNQLIGCENKHHIVHLVNKD